LEADAPILVEVRGPREQVTNQLKNVDGVARVTHQAVDGEVHLFQVQTRNSKDLREIIAQRLISSGYGIRRLERRASLRDYFEGRMGARDPAPAPAVSATAPAAPSEAVTT